MAEPVPSEAMHSLASFSNLIVLVANSTVNLSRPYDIQLTSYPCSRINADNKTWFLQINVLTIIIVFQ